MAVFFLIIIYLSFISLGLPDALLGSAWPVIQPELGAPLGAAGILSMIVAGGTIVSSLFSGAAVNRLGTGKVTLISCIMTACSLLGFSYAPSLGWLMLLAVPLGLGAGAVDAGLNHYVATRYKAHHMSWLHSFWGVGATLGPIIMSGYIQSNGWRNGYLAVSWVQFGLVALLFLSLPMWKRDQEEQVSAADEINEREDGGASGSGAGEHPLRMKGVRPALLTFLLYCGVEMTVGLWSSSFLVSERGLSAAEAAGWVSLYYGGITAGRFITGFVTMKVSNKLLIRWGELTVVAGAALLLLPLPSGFALAGLILIGLGCAPIYPCMLHETPIRFGKRQSQRIMGYQMAVAYTGSTFLPPLLGWAAGLTSIAILPFVVLLYAAAMFISSEFVNRALIKGSAGNG